VHVTIPEADGNAYRYTLENGNGIVTASCTQIVRNVPLKMVVTHLDIWFDSLREHLISYTRLHADAVHLLEHLT
jgi:hypothetical protein